MTRSRPRECPDTGGRLDRRDERRTVTLREAGARVKARPKTLRNLLARHRAEFPVREYRRDGGGRRMRLLSEAEVVPLGALLRRWREGLSSEK